MVFVNVLGMWRQAYESRAKVTTFCVPGMLEQADHGRDLDVNHMATEAFAMEHKEQSPFFLQPSISIVIANGVQPCGHVNGTSRTMCILRDLLLIESRW